MTVHSGKHGSCNGLSTLRNWQVSDVSAPQKAIASNTKNGVARRRGIRSWTGSAGFYGATPPVMPGEFFDFGGYTSPDDDVSGDGVIYEGEALVDSVTITWNWGNGEIISSNMSFSGHLELTSDSGEFLDASTPDLPEICGTKILTPTTEWENVVQATLTITAANQPYVNSSTGCWTGRKAGPIDCTLAVVEQNVERDFLSIYDDVELKLFTTATLFWHLKWMHLKEFTGINVDRESGAILSRTANFEKNGFVSGSTGFIKKPDTTTFWPAP